MSFIRRRLPQIVLSIFILIQDRSCYERDLFNNTKCSGNISSGSTHLNDSNCKETESTLDVSEEDELWRVILERSQLFITIIGK